MTAFIELGAAGQLLPAGQISRKHVPLNPGNFSWQVLIF